MGMDVYGKNPTDEVGEYFRRNVWGWHPLWEMVEDLFPELASKVQEGHTNSGDGLNAVDSEQLGTLLAEAAKDGRVALWIKERNEAVAALPMEDCQICDGTGIRSDEAGIKWGQHDKALSSEQAAVLGREFGWCNGCEGNGWRAPFASHYGTSVECAGEFSDFLAASGGFEIC